MIPKSITILGAGLTGLSTAYHLTRKLPSTTKITLVEASNRLGGWMNSTKVPLRFRDAQGELREGQAVIEAGVRSIRPRGSRGAVGMLRLIKDLDLLDDLIPIPNSHPAAKNRYLLDPLTSKLTRLPSSLTSILQPQPRLLKGLLPSILTEPFKSRPRNLSIASDESLDSFIRRRLGGKIADNMISAMVHGIYAASSTELSVRSTFGVLYDAEKIYGSVVVGMLLGTKSRQEKAIEKREWDGLGDLGKIREGWSLYGFKGGLGRLGERLHQVIESQRVEVVLNRRVTALTPVSGGVELEYGSSSTSTTTSSHVISTLSPSTLNTLLPVNHPLPNLTTNPSTSVGVVNLIYPLPPTSIHPEGFGYLIPRSEPGSNPSGVLGVVFDSTALPGMDDPQLEGRITKLTIMMGGPHWSLYPSSGSTQTPIAIPKSPEELIPLAIQHVQNVFPALRAASGSGSGSRSVSLSKTDIDSESTALEPIYQRAMIHTNCIPTYLPGHGDRLRELHENMTHGVWAGKLSLAGSGYGGVGVNDCVAMGEDVVDGLAAATGEGVTTGLERWEGWV